MIWHPLLLAVLFLDSLSLLMVVASAAVALRIVLGWSPEAADSGQIQLEIKAETVSIQVRSAALVFGVSSAILIAAIANVLPGVVPGAMCGMGVMQACKGIGSRALAYRFLAVGIMAVWHVLDRLNRSQPDFPLATAGARMVLLLTPFLFMACLESGKAILALDVHQPVDCCAVVYDQVRPLSQAGVGGHISERYWILGFIVIGALVFGNGVALWSSKPLERTGLAFTLPVLSLLWAPVAYGALVRVLAAYHYEVLHHHCPWCLFLAEHKLVGYPLLVSLAVTVLEGCSAFAASRVGKQFPQLASSAARRSQTAGLRAAMAAALFIGLAGLPAIVWRLRFGVWM